MRLPDTISLNTIDRSYLIPEAEDSSVYFPMTVCMVIPLCQTLTVEQMQQALKTLNQMRPYLRLQYRLDRERNRWQRIDDTQVDAHLCDIVNRLDDHADLDETLSTIITRNSIPQHPIRFNLLGNVVIIDMHHTFGDGQFLLQLSEELLTVLAQPDQPVNDDKTYAHSLPMHTLVRKHPLLVWRNWFSATFASYREYKRDLEASDEVKTRLPVKSGYPMCVRRYTIPAETVARLNSIRKALPGDKRISVNTFLQVLIGDALHTALGEDIPITYSIPVDLSRYLSNDTRYAGNLATQIRVTLPQNTHIAAQCAALQAEVERQLAQGMPLANLPNEWLLRLAGDKVYDRVNRDWLIASTNTDPRRFVLSNLGENTRRFSVHRDLLDFEAGLHFVAPLMGGPGIAICANTLDQRLNLTVTIDPKRYNERHLDAITRIFEPECLDELAQRLGNA